MREAEAIRAQLSDTLTEHDHVAVDCTGATAVDVSLVQLLLAARRSARRWGKSLELAVPTADVLHDALARGGFRLLLDDPAGRDDGI